MEVLVEEQGYDANDLIRNRKDDDGKSSDDDQKTHGYDTLKTRNVTPMEIKVDNADDVSVALRSDNVSKQIDNVMKEHNMLNPQENIENSTEMTSVKTTDPMMMTMMRLMQQLSQQQQPQAMPTSPRLNSTIDQSVEAPLMLPSIERPRQVFTETMTGGFQLKVSPKDTDRPRFDFGADILADGSEDPGVAKRPKKKKKKKKKLD